MPELAEVEFYRKCWDSGIGKRITAVHVHAGKRIFRRTRPMDLASLAGRMLERSEARGKQLLFTFSGRSQCWLGLHLGMTGKLSVAGPNFAPGRHDHLVLYLVDGALVFHDPRLFGAVQFAEGP